MLTRDFYLYYLTHEAYKDPPPTKKHNFPKLGDMAYLNM